MSNSRFESNPFWKERRQRQKYIRRRKQVAVLCWFLALGMVGVGSAAAVSVVNHFTQELKIPPIVILGASLLGALVGGIIGFVPFYTKDLLGLIAMAMTNDDPPAPQVVAWQIGIPLAILAAGLPALDGGWLYFSVALVGGVGGFGIWWWLGRHSAANRNDPEQVVQDG